jgi:hypothetical protein
MDGVPTVPAEVESSATAGFELVMVTFTGAEGMTLRDTLDPTYTPTPVVRFVMLILSGVDPPPVVAGRLTVAVPDR